MATRHEPELFQGTWEIMSTELWDKDALDLVEEAQLRFGGLQGELVMIAVRGSLDCE